MRQFYDAKFLMRMVRKKTPVRSQPCKPKAMPAAAHDWEWETGNNLREQRGLTVVILVVIIILAIGKSRIASVEVAGICVAAGIVVAYVGGAVHIVWLLGVDGSGAKGITRVCGSTRVVVDGLWCAWAARGAVRHYSLNRVDRGRLGDRKSRRQCWRVYEGTGKDEEAMRERERKGEYGVC